MYNSPRPFTRPGRFTSVTVPVTQLPAGIAMRPFARMGNAVSRYTRSPSLVVLVLMLLIRLSGTFVPAAMVNTPARGAASCAARADAAKAMARKDRRNIASLLERF